MNSAWKSLLNWKDKIALGLFLLSRFWIFSWRPEISDLEMYHRVASQGTWGNLEIYKDFPLAYPPLSWWFIRWPELLNSTLDLEQYRFAFRGIYMLLEIAFVILLFLKASRQAWGPRVKALVLYTFAGCCLGDVLYDRVDLFMVFFLVLIFLFWNAQGFRGKAVFNLSLIAGFFCKLLPLGFFFLHWPQQIREKKWKALVYLWVPVFCLLTLIFLNFQTYPGLIASLANHGSRGIQVESTWAAPFLLDRTFSVSSPTKIAYVFGANDIDPSVVPDWYALLARSLGFVVLGVMYFWFLCRSWDMKSLNERARVFLLFILAFMVFQRVLSIQFFLWTLPFFAIWAASQKWWRLIPFGLMYALCFVTFTLGYWKIVLEADPLFTCLLALRHGLMIGVFLQLLAGRTTTSCEAFERV